MTSVKAPDVTCPECEKPMACYFADNQDSYWRYSCAGCGLHLDLTKAEDDE